MPNRRDIAGLEPGSFPKEEGRRQIPCSALRNETYVFKDNLKGVRFECGVFLDFRDNAQSGGQVRFVETKSCMGLETLFNGTDLLRLRTLN